MKKIIPTTILCFIICFLPLIGNISSYTHPKFLTIVFFFYLLFFTQPTFKAKDIQGNAETDKFSMLFITLGVIIIISGSLIDWGYFQENKNLFWDTYTIAGLILLVFGSTIRIWAIYFLGKYFTNAVQFDAKHELIKSGPYRLIRHPSYLGAYLAIIGSALFLNSILLFLIGSVLMFAIYSYRISVEEIGLIQQFEDEYAEYQKNSKKLLPFLY